MTPDAREAQAVIEQAIDRFRRIADHSFRELRGVKVVEGYERVQHRLLYELEDAAKRLLADVLGSPLVHDQKHQEDTRVDEHTVIPPERATAAENQTTPTRFLKKPVVIEAMQFDGTRESAQRIVNWADTPAHVAVAIVGDHRQIDIVTLEGVMTAGVNDWIIRGIKGEFYPCKPDIFAATYEPASAEVVSPTEQEEHWQPIETAPKDRILWLYDQSNRAHYMGWWYPGGGDNGEGCFAYEGESIGFSRRQQPTHWMLPTVPPASR